MIERTLPEEHPGLQRARGNLAATITRLIATRRVEKKGGDDEGAWPRARDLVSHIARGQVQAARGTISTASVREAEERMGRRVEFSFGLAVSIATGYGVFDPEEFLLGEAFTLSETTRAAALASAGLVRAQLDVSERERLRAEISAAGAELAEIARRGATREEYHRARSRREAAERDLLALTR